jgi:exonuclease
MTPTTAAPIGIFAGLPLYRHGGAPAHLRTVTRLAAIRLQPAPGQRPVCYVVPYYHPGERRALYEPADAAPVVRSVGDDWAWRARRTCPRCGEVREHVIHGSQCGQCSTADRLKDTERWKRTCSGCRRVGSKPYPQITVGAWNTQRLCRFCVAERNRKKEELLRAAIRCAGGCGKRTATKAEVLAWALAKHQAIARWERRCAPCQAARDAEQEQLKAERETRWAKERAEERARGEAARMSRENELAELRAWAAAVLADPDAVILDTETTGLSDDARIVDIAVTTVHGEVLLDTLVNPGGPIPPSATAIHGITDEMVAVAPTFAQVLPDLAAAVFGRRVLIYNDAFDIARLRHELALIAADVHEFTAAARWEDAMAPYSDWCGDWSEWHGNYRWQPLNGGHRALGDCLAVIDCLKAMARGAGDEDEERVV